MLGARDGTARFFAIALGFTWALQLPAALGAMGLLADAQRFVPLAGIGGFGPLVAAIVAARWDPTTTVRALFAQLKPRVANVAWYPVALLLPGLLLAATVAAYKLAGGGGDVTYWYLPSQPERVVALFIVPIVEELGWRGYALPRLEKRYGPLLAAVILGVLWWAWHLAMFTIVGLSVTTIILALPMLVAGSVGFSWIYRRTGGSLPLMVVAHMGAHLNNSHLPLPANPLPSTLHTMGWVVFAVAIALIDRATWRSAPRAES